ncbi:hypothetical protein FACS1894199_15860 [Bacteroidia bacterium]|nr:hypothetical protein FACS1894199_15860 [Bacteroidia bacterium]
MKRASNIIAQIQDLDNLYLAYFKAKRGKLARGLWDERTYQQHITPLLAFAKWAYTKQYYSSLPN